MNHNQKFVVCIENKDCDDLEKRKIYHVIGDEAAEAEGYIRIVDESGEDYLYPASYFAEIDLPVKVRETFLAAG